MWKKLEIQEDIDDLMRSFGNFHDSCITEFKYLSGAFVNEDLSMYPVNDKRLLTIVFQRQSNDIVAIEMQFKGLQQLNIYPVNEEYTCEISEVTVSLEENGIFWYDSYRMKDDDIYNYKGAFIHSSEVYWRVIKHNNT